MQDGKTTLREHVVTFARLHPTQAAEALARVTPAPPMAGTATACAAFDTLANTRRAGMAGPEPLTLTDVDAYARLVCPLSPEDVTLILAMDAAYLSEVAAHG